jgi:Membrane transporters of cations and cationic drugs
MTWFYLVLAGIFEVVWATTMKLSEGFSVLTYGIATAVGMIMSFVFLSLAIKQMPLSLAYPIWTGIGAVGSIIVGVILFHDQIPNITWFFIIMLIVGIIGIKMTAGH